MRMSFPGFLDLNEQSSTSFLNQHHMKSVIRKLLWHSTEIFLTFSRFQYNYCQSTFLAKIIYIPMSCISTLMESEKRKFGM